MSRPRFSEMLIERRRQLGLTIEQASRVLKLKESVLIAFEDGDFPSIPKSGYAQGMLASYARYLGLNPREIVDQFQEDLYEHSNNGVSSHELRRRTRESRGVFSDPTYELPTRSRSNNPRLPETQHLLPDNPQLGRTDAYDTTSRARSRSQTWRQSSPLVSGSRYSDGYPQGRPYNAQGAYDAYSRQRSRQARTQAQGQARGQLGDGGDVRNRRYGSSYGSGYGTDYGYRRDDVVQRDVSSRQYDDDLRVNNDARPYQAASTRQGRKSYRSIANTERPRVQRRSNDAGRRQLQSRSARRQPQRQGVMGFLENYFSDSRRTIITVLLALVVVLVLIISFSVRSCASAVVPQTREVSVSSVATSQAASTAATSQAASSAAAATTPATTTEEAVTEVSVTVKVADGAVTWLEIDNGGKSEVAETITGPWERTYSVNSEMTIQVADTSAVTVTKNGQTVKFDERSSGVGTISIEGPKVKASTTAASSSAADGGEGEGDAAGSDGSDE